MYSYNNSSFTWAEQDLYGSSRLGMVTPGLTIQGSAPLANANYNSTGDPITNGTEGKRTYELTNHLGNVMVTISDRKTGVDENSDGVIDYYKAEVLTAQDYYAFGMMMPGRTYSNAGAKYKYGFNGKENDNEVKGDGNQQDYGMRIYDPRLGRFLSVDPLAVSYPWYTPYQFAGNKPTIAIDLDGLEEYIVVNYYNRNKELERTSIITLTNRNSQKLVDMQMRAVMRNDKLGSLEAQGKKVLVRHVFSDDGGVFASERRDILTQNETYALNNGQKLGTGTEDPFSSPPSVPAS